MNANEINKIYPQLFCSIDQAIIDTMDLTIKRSVSKSTSFPSEPEFVASLSIDFTEKLYNILKNAFPKHKFGITGVYCHQRPIVNIGESVNPELGDILLVYAEKTASKTRFNSLLLQAKMSDEDKTTVAKTDMHQLKLYSKWPTFTYYKPVLTTEVRNILPKTIHSGAQYLLINKRYQSNNGHRVLPPYAIACAVPDKTLYMNRSLAFDVIDFLKFASGRSFLDKGDPRSDDWSKMIWELLENTAGKNSKLKKAGRSSFPRLNQHGCCLFASNLGLSLDNTENSILSNEAEGISIILIESISEQSDEWRED